jgi:DNA anti-recombination protein RmuC
VAFDDARPRRSEHWLQVATLVATSVLLGILGWMAMQFVAMRDDTHALKDQLETVQQQITDLKDNLGERLNRVEARVDKLDDEARERAR